MGDAGDHADVGRFMRSPEGTKVLERFRQGLVGKRIADVQFQHNTAGVSIVFTFEDRDLLDLGEAVEAFSVDTLRRRYRYLLDREYYVDFPDRRSAASTAEADSPVARFVCPECGASVLSC